MPMRACTSVCTSFATAFNLLQITAAYKWNKKRGEVTRESIAGGTIDHIV